MIFIFLITNKNLIKENLMLKAFQETFQSLLNQYQWNSYYYKIIKKSASVDLKIIIISICNYKSFWVK